jgi:hypothetical protein
LKVQKQTGVISVYKFSPNRLTKAWYFLTILNMAEPAHEEEMPDATAGAEQDESKFGEGDKEDPTTKTIRIVRRRLSTT